MHAKTAESKAATKEFEMTLEISGCTVIGQVIKQSEELRRPKTNAIRFIGSKMSIYSAARPALSTEIYIRGRLTSHDDDYMFIEFSTPEEAMEYYQKVLTTLEEWRAVGFNLSSY